MFDEQTRYEPEIVAVEKKTTANTYVDCVNTQLGYNFISKICITFLILQDHLGQKIYAVSQKPQ